MLSIAGLLRETTKTQWPILGLTRIGNPFIGRSVTRCSGHTLTPGGNSKSNRWTSVARTSVASCNAKAEPMQVRGPVPKGRYENRPILSLDLPRNR